jgi:8-oxo-dGTP diphosphatase
MSTKFHYRVRGVIFKEGQLLVAQMKSATNTFLPGGHVDDGESAPVALVREFQEELGINSSVKSFLGAIENSWVQDNVLQHEVNLIFEVHASDLSPQNAVASKEDHLDFFWLKLEDFESKNFLPVPARDCIRRWAEGEKSPWWGSTI